MKQATMYQFGVLLPTINSSRYTCIYYLVAGESSEHARARLLERLVENALTFEHVDAGREMGPVQLASSVSVSRADALKRMGKPAEAPKPPPAPKLSTRPLGDIQRSLLRGLVEHKGWSGNTWVWDNYSGTQRRLDALVQRCLVDKTGSMYTINNAGREALLKKTK
jgi:hypothetical protein